MGRIKAKLTEQIPQPVPIQVEGYGEILVFPPTLEEQASIQAAKESNTPGRAATLTIYYVLRRNDPDVGLEDVQKMNIMLPENQALVEGIGQVMIKFSSFRSGDSNQQQP